MLLLFGAEFRTYDGYDLISYNGIHIGGDTRLHPVPRADRRPQRASC